MLRYVPCILSHVNYNYVTYFPTDLSSDIFPLDIDSTVGSIKLFTVTEKEETFCLGDHEIYVTVPSEAIPTGMNANMLLSASLFPPVNFLNNATPVSAIVWLHMDPKPNKLITLKMPHFLNITDDTQSKYLNFAMSNCNDDNTMTMNVIEGGKFPKEESYGTIKIEPSCYYCIQCEKVKRKNVPDNEYQIVVMKEKQLNASENSWKIDFCVVPKLPTCVKVLATYILYVCVYVSM